MKLVIMIASKDKRGQKIMAKLIERKIINRKYYEHMGALVTKDGHLAYSRVDDKGNIIEDEEGVYVQLRSYNGGLFMQRI